MVSFGAVNYSIGNQFSCVQVLVISFANSNQVPKIMAIEIFFP